MKLNTISLIQLALIATTTVNAQCVEGKREVIVPGYEVEYRCDVYRPGTLISNVASTQDCALLAKDTPPYISSYDPPSKKCIVAREGGELRTRAGTYYTFKVEPSDVDCPEPPTCPNCPDCPDDSALKDELEACKKNSKQTSVQCSRDDLQMVPVSGENYRVYCSRTWPFYDDLDSFSKIPTLSECGEKCNENVSCSFVHYQPKDGECILYSTPHNDKRPSQGNEGNWQSLLKEGK